MACQNLAPLDPVLNADTGQQILDKLNLAFAKTDSNQDCYSTLEVFQALQLTGLPAGLSAPVPANATFKDAINYNFNSVGDINNILPGTTNIIDALILLYDSRALEAVYGLSRAATQAEVNTGSSHVGIGDSAFITPFTLASITANSPLANALTDVIQATTPSNQATEAEQGMAQIATQAETDTGVNDQTIVTPLKLKNIDAASAQGIAISDLTPHSAEGIFGKLQIATQGESNAGTDDAKAVSPLKLKTFFSTANATEVVVGTIQLATQIETDAGVNNAKAVTPLKLVSYFNSRVATEATDGIVQMASDAETQIGAAGALAVSPEKLINLFNSRTAQETLSGSISLATTAETTTGTNDSKAVTPLKLKQITDVINTNNTNNTTAISNNANAIASNDADILTKANNAVLLTAGTGISGGGDLTASRTFNLDMGSLGLQAGAQNNPELIAIVAGTQVRLPWSLIEKGQLLNSQVTTGFSSISTTYVSTGASATITPRSASSKVRISVFGNTDVDNAGALVSVDITKGGVSMTPAGSNAFVVANAGANERFYSEIVDTPGAGTFTYELKIKTTAGTAYIGSDTASANVTPFGITVEEIIL